jgi:hypothetical protein
LQVGRNYHSLPLAATAISPSLLLQPMCTRSLFFFLKRVGAPPLGSHGALLPGARSLQVSSRLTFSSSLVSTAKQQGALLLLSHGCRPLSHGVTPCSSNQCLHLPPDLLPLCDPHGCPALHSDPFPWLQRAEQFFWVRTRAVARRRPWTTSMEAAPLSLLLSARSPLRSSSACPSHGASSLGQRSSTSP